MKQEEKSNNLEFFFLDIAKTSSEILAWAYRSICLNKANFNMLKIYHS